MRRTYMSPEFKYTEVPGTYNKKNESNFMCNTLFNIPNNISIGNFDIMYYTNSNDEQLSNTTTSLKTVMVNTSDIKNEYHNINGADRSWAIKIDYNGLLQEYIFHMLKKQDTFLDITNEMVLEKRVNFYIKNYIKENFIDLFILDKVDLYIEYVDLSMDNVYKNGPIYDRNIIKPSNVYNKINIQKENDLLDLNFNLAYDTNKYTFRYYFNLNFKR